MSAGGGSERAVAAMSTSRRGGRSISRCGLLVARIEGAPPRDRNELPAEPDLVAPEAPLEEVAHCRDHRRSAAHEDDVDGVPRQAGCIAHAPSARIDLGEVSCDPSLEARAC